MKQPLLPLPSFPRGPRRLPPTLLLLLATALGAQAQAPTVTGTTPAPNAVAAPRAGATSVSLSQPLSAGSGAAFKVFSSQRGGLRTTATPATVSGSTVSYAPSPYPFLPGETVTGVLTTAAQSSAGTPLAQPYFYQFTTQTAPAPATYQTQFISIGRGRFVKLADVNNDGFLDFLTPAQAELVGGGGAGSNGNSLAIVLSNGVTPSNLYIGTRDAIPVDLAVGDVDGDGDLDVVTANTTGVACVLLNVSNTTQNPFQPYVLQPDVPLPAAAGDVELADVDGDGDLDLVLTQPGRNALAVLPNAGNGTFGTAQLVSTGTNPRQLAVGDVNNDGRLDLLSTTTAATGAGYAVSVRPGTGGGSFAATGPEVPIGGEPTNLVLGDLNGDGAPDLVTADVGSYFASVRLNNGQGSFATTGQELPIGNNVNGAIAGEVNLGDLDGDGDLDLLTTMEDPIPDPDPNAGSIRRQGFGQSFNNGNGTFAPFQFVAQTQSNVGFSTLKGAVAGDLDNDGDLDVLIHGKGGSSDFSDGVTYLNFAPVPTITSFTPTSGGATTSVVIRGTDFNSTRSVTFNGLAAPSFTIDSPTQVTATVPVGATTGPIMLTTLGGTATSATPFTVVVQVVGLAPARNTNTAPTGTNATLTYSESLNSATAGGVRVFSQQAGGRKASQTSATGSTITVNPAVNFQPGETVYLTSPATVTSARGLVGQPFVAQFTTQAGVGPGVFNGAAEVAVGSGPTSVAPTDVDNDGDLDLVVANYFNNTVSVRLNQGAGTFSGTQELALAGSHTRVRTADVNGDGNLDLLVANAGGTVSVRLGSGTGTFSGSQEVAVDADPQDLIVADLDGDGDLDLATAHGSSSTVSVRRNDGTGSFTGTDSYAPGPLQLFSLVAGDVDHDGDLDLLAGSANAAQVAVLRNAGPGTFTAGPAVPIAAATFSVALGDVNNDGNLDLLATGATTVSVRLGNGAGGFSGSQEVPVGDNLQALALSDIDGDGDLDLFATLFAGAVSLRLNDGTGTFTGSQQVSVGTNTKGLALADLDGDGDLDLLATSYVASGTVSVRLNALPGPTLASFTPASGPVGTSVTLTGTNFAGATAVTFNGTTAPGFVVNSATQITATVPTGATTGLIAVTTPLGMATSATPFTVTFAPVLTATAGPTSVPEQVATVVDAGLTLTDADSPTLASATVSISSGLVSGEDELAFPATSGITGSYAAGTGVLTLNGPASVAQWQTLLRGVTYRNRSATPATADRTVSFVVSDGTLASAPATKLVQVQAVNSAPTTPTDADATANTVAENAATGTLVGLTVAATDADNPTLTYSLTNNAGGRFTVNASTGVVSVANGALLNYEAATSYSVTAQATDGTLTSSASFTVQVSDVNEAPVVANQTLAIPAGSPNGTVVGPVAATDPDAGSTLTYSITAGNTNGAFTFVGNQLRVANSTALGSSAFSLSVQVADNGSPALSSAAIITVNITPATCQAPTAVTASNITPTTARVSFTGSSTASGGYTVTYSVSGGTSQTVAATASPINLTGLTPNTTYAVTVRINCGGQTASSAAVSFTTSCTAPVVTAPANQTAPAEAGQSSASVSFAATATGTPAPTLRYTLNNTTITSPYRFPVGTSTVTATASSCGGTDSKTFTVTVTAPAPPATLAVVSTSPARNARTAPSSTNVVLTYNQAVSSATAVNVRVFSAQAGGRKAATTTTSSSTITVNPGTNFRAGETVWVTSPATVRGAANSNTPGRPTVYQFTTAVSASAGRFSGGSVPGVGQTPVSVVAADVDNDGDLDLLSANTNDNTVSVRRNNGSGSFSGNTSVAVGSYPAHLVAADVDADGDLDLLVANAGSDNVSVRLNNGSGNFNSSGPNVAVGDSPISVAAADLDGDGDLDLLTANLDSDNVSVRFNNGSGSFAGGSTLAVGPNTASVEAADVDADGDLDLLIANASSSGTVSVRLNNGAGGFSGTASVAVGSYPAHVAAADLDGDGDLDLLTANTGSSNTPGTVSVRLGNGSGSFSGSGTVPVGSRPASVEAADVNGDGNLDLLTANAGSNTVSVRLGNGNGSFSSTGQEVTVGAVPVRVAAADLDNDGDLDVLAANADSDNVSVRFNQNQASRGLAATEDSTSTSPTRAFADGNLLAQLTTGRPLTTTAGIPAPAPTLILESYPNPFHEEVRLAFRLAHTDAYTLAVYDLQGRLVERLSGGSAVAGELRQVSWRAERYPAGVYLVRLSSASGVKLLKLVKQ